VRATLGTSALRICPSRIDFINTLHAKRVHRIPACLLRLTLRQGGWKSPSQLRLAPWRRLLTLWVVLLYVQRPASLVGVKRLLLLDKGVYRRPRLMHRRRRHRSATMEPRIARFAGSGVIANAPCLKVHAPSLTTTLLVLFGGTDIVAFQRKSASSTIAKDAILFGLRILGRYKRAEQYFHLPTLQRDLQIVTSNQQLIKYQV
jgi:hypothetical protein